MAIVKTIHDLFGIVLHLLTFAYDNENNDKTSEDSSSTKIESDYQQSSDTDAALCMIFQTLYRLMLTPMGNCHTGKDEGAMNIFSTKLTRIKDDFTLYWALKCASALLLPRPFAMVREEANEVSNKHKMLTQIPDLVTFLVGKRGDFDKGCLPPQPSELVLMVVSNILESILCSHQDTTTPEGFSSLVSGLADGYVQKIIYV
jgi:hypothetical protein